MASQKFLLAFFLSLSFIFIITSNADDEPPPRYYITKIKEWTIKGSEEVTARGIIHSFGDGSKIFPNVSLFVHVVHPVKKVFCQVGVRFSSNNCNLCHLLANHTFDACKLFMGIKMPRNVMRFFNDVNSNGIFPKKCPVTKGEFNFRNILLRGKSLPQYMPLGLFNIKLVVSEDIKMQKILIDSNFLGDITRKKNH